MDFLKLNEVDEKSRLLATIEAEAWIRFAAAGVSRCGSSDRAADFADNLLAEFRQRFVEVKGG